jgi:hypothetical protein
MGAWLESAQRNLQLRQVYGAGAVEEDELPIQRERRRRRLRRARS